MVTDMNDALNALIDTWETTIPSLGTSGMQFALLVVLTIIFTISILYMISIALRGERMRRWLIGELMQAFASVLIIFGLVALATFLTGAAYGLGTIQCAMPADINWGIGTGSIPVDTPLEYVACKFKLIDDQLNVLYYDVTRMNMHAERMLWSCWIFFGVEIQCGWDKHPLVESLHALAYKIIQYRMGLQSALVLVNYMLDWLLPLFLPIGVILRAIPFTRGAGGLLIALVLGFYFVFPMVFTLADLLLSQQLNKPDMEFIDVNANQCVYSDLAGAMGVYAADSSMVHQMALTVSTIRSMLVALVLQALLAPLMALAVTILFIRAFSPLLGSDSYMVMYGISKML